MSAPQKPVLDLTILPIDVEIERCIVSLLEVAKLNLPWDEYLVSVQVRCGDASSQIFHVSYRDSRELMTKLRFEVAKFKYLLYVLGRDRLRQLGIIKQ
jgi:hypothetical protein